MFRPYLPKGNVLFGLFGWLYGNCGEHRPHLFIKLVIPQGNLCGHGDPAALGQILRTIILAHKAHELNVLHAAGHNKPARNKAALFHFFGMSDLRLKTDGFAGILLHVLGDIPVPDAVIIILDLDDISVEIKGKGILDLVIFHAAILRLIGNIATAIDASDDFVELHFVDGIVITIEYDHFASANLIHHKGAHVVVVHHKGGGVGKHDLLIDHPVFRHGGVKITDQLHAVELYADTFGVVLLSQGFQYLVIQGILILDGFNIDVGGSEGAGVVFLFALFADEKQGLLAGVEPVIL